MELNVLTLNVWGLKLLSKQRVQRVNKIGAHLAKCTADVVCLQEVWVRKDAQTLAAAAASGRLVHSFRFGGARIGSGLLLLSAYPIVEASFAPYRSDGTPLAVLPGDYFADKGIANAAITTPAGLVRVLFTHMAANAASQRRTALEGCSDVHVPHDAQDAARVAQVLQLSATAQAAAERSDTAAVVVCGDFNAESNSLEMATFRALTPWLHDVWTGQDDGATVNLHKGERASRIDYVFTNASVANAEVSMVAAEGELPYSDHAAVQAQVTLPASKFKPCSAREAVATSPLVFEANCTVLSRGIKRMACHTLLLNAIGTVMLALGIALVAVAGGKAVMNWGIPNTWFVLMMVVGTVLLGVSPVLSAVALLCYAPEQAALQASLNEMQLLMGLSNRTASTGTRTAAAPVAAAAVANTDGGSTTELQGSAV